MLDTAGVGGAGGTSWISMTLEQMATLIRNPDTDKHYELLTGWQRSADLVNEHRWQVQNYRDNLAAAWPPQKSPAAAAYLARLDEMIANLKETYEAAAANHDAFASATLSISLAQKDFEKIFQDYQVNQQLLIDFEAQQQKPSASLSRSLLAKTPPVPDGRQEELRLQAVSLLSGVSADLAQAQVSIRRPAEYKRPYGFDDHKEAVPGTYVAPPIPPITANSSNSESSGISSNRQVAPFPTSPTIATPNPVPTTSQPGLILGGANPPTAVPPPVSASPPPNLTPTPGFNPTTPPSIGILPPATAPANPGNGTVESKSPGVGRSLGSSTEGTFRVGGQAPEGMRAMPPGGLIGGVGGGGLGQPGATRPGIRRVNPIGGLIGEGSSMPHGGRNAASLNSAPPVLPYGGRGGHSSDPTDSTDRWDPDNPWQTAEGVAPVVLPASPPRIDPGPVIGLP